MNSDALPDTSTPVGQPIVPVAVIPLLRETLDVERVQYETGALRVRVVIDQVTQAVPNDAVVEEVSSIRIPRGQRVDARREPWTDGDVLVVPVYEEIVVTERRLVLKEEIHITRRTHRSSELLEVPLRQERAVVERRRPDGVWIVDEA